MATEVRHAASGGEFGDPGFGSPAGDLARVIARGLLAIRAVEIRPSEPFTWSSGWRSPIYCDNRLIWGYPVLREQVLAGLQQLLSVRHPSVELLAGTATAGIPHAAMLADRLRLPMVYVRGQAKGHGKGRRVEGRCLPGQRAVVIEDTLSTGASSFDAAAALQAEGVLVEGVVAVFSYNFDAMWQRSQDAGIPVSTLLDYDTLVHTAVLDGYVEPSQLEVLMQWRQAPDVWGQPADR